jgi:hypothetical protein
LCLTSSPPLENSKHQPNDDRKNHGNDNAEATLQPQTLRPLALLYFPIVYSPDGEFVDLGVPLAYSLLSIGEGRSALLLQKGRRWGNTGRAGTGRSRSTSREGASTGRFRTTCRELNGRSRNTDGRHGVDRREGIGLRNRTRRSRHTGREGTSTTWSRRRGAGAHWSSTGAGTSRAR